MDVAFLRKTFALIAKGLIEKEELLQKEPTRYPYSKTFQHGINMFLTASQWAGCQTVTQYANEASFLAHFITKPIKAWFDGWNPEIIKKLNLREELLYGCEAFAYQRSGAIYVPTPDCYEFLKTQDSDIMDGTDERYLYDKMISLDQETYCKIRKYLIEHPIITIEDRRIMLLDLVENQTAREAFQFAYEQVREDCYRCPTCGWTMVQRKYGYYCHSIHCTDPEPVLTDEMKLDASGGNLYRLKKGIMLYWASPGKLELEIAGFCEKKKIHYALWPQMDRFDVEIHFSDGEVWEIDAKAYRNPKALCKKIQEKIQNATGFFDGSDVRGYYVIPSEYTKNQPRYTAIINRVLMNQKNVKCITQKTLKTKINKKEASCREKE